MPTSASLLSEQRANRAPNLKWFSAMLACGTRRQRLFIDGAETPYFIDSANGIRAHKSQGDEHGLFGAGMGEALRLDCPDRRIAAPLGSGSNVRLLKHRAEQMALESVS